MYFDEHEVIRVISSQSVRNRVGGRAVATIDRREDLEQACPALGFGGDQRLRLEGQRDQQSGR